MDTMLSCEFSEKTICREMLMAREFLPIFSDWLQVTEELNAQEKGRLIDAMVMYAFGGDWQEQIKGNERYLFPAFKRQIDRGNEISEVRAGARLGKKKQVETNENKSEQTKTNDNKTEQKEETITNDNKINEEEKEEEKEKEKEEENKDKEKKKEKARLDSAFELFWAAYPNKKAKQDALKAFMKLAPDENLLDQMLAALETQKSSQQWRKDNGQFIPLPATWLNGKRWTDQQQAEVAPIPNIVALKPTAVQNYEQRDYKDREKQLMERMMKLADEE